MKTNLISRRAALKGSVLGLIGVSVPLVAHPNFVKSNTSAEKMHAGYPSISLETVQEVVGKSHFDLDRVKELVGSRPELSTATWDWGFGDFETAVGAASHVGRRDIIEYLLSKGARPDLFTYTTLGAYDTVKSMIEITPGIQKTLGPHGISLLSHAQAGLRTESTMSAADIANAKKLVSYLESLGDADGEQYEEMTESEKQKCVGDYMYGAGEKEGFTLKLNSRKQISLGKLGAFGGSLYKIGENKFFYNGAPSTVISFQFEKEKVISLTVTEPGSVLLAKKVNI